MTLSEYRNQLVRLKNMALLCHCSAEIDQGTLLFFSVNNMFLGQGDCFVLLFSESSAPAPRKEHGEDLYGRVYLYALINEVLAEVLGGQFSYYSAELDGRLVAIIHFPLGLLPSHAHDLPLLIQDSCAEIAQLCRERYDLRVTSYLSDRVSDIASISVVYHKLLNLVTLHRYLQLIPAAPVVLVTPPPPNEHIEPFPVRQLAQKLAELGLAGTDWQPLPAAKHIFSHLEWQLGGFECRAADGCAPAGCVWADEAALAGEYALPGAFKAYRKRMMQG